MQQHPDHFPSLKEIEGRLRLHLALYEALKRCCRKAGAFYKGIIIPLCKSGVSHVSQGQLLRGEPRDMYGA